MKNCEKKQNPVKKKERRVINMNYPPADMPMEEVERFWGSPDDIVPLRKRKWKESNAKPSPV